MSIQEMSPFQLQQQVLKQESDQMRAIREKHKGNIYAAYEEDPALFARAMPRMVVVGWLKDDPITDAQASVVFPILRLAGHFDLADCPNLTGACLASLPKSVTWLSCPKNLAYSDLTALEGQDSLKDLFIYAVSDRTRTAGLETLSKVPLTRLEMQGPVTQEPFMKWFPNTLQILHLRSASFSDQELSSFLDSDGSKQLTDLYLTGVATITAEAFKDKELPKTVHVDGCKDVDQDRFYQYVPKGPTVRHMTQQQIEKERAFRYGGKAPETKEEEKE